MRRRCGGGGEDVGGCKKILTIRLETMKTITLLSGLVE